MGQRDGHWRIVLLDQAEIANFKKLFNFLYLFILKKKMHFEIHVDFVSVVANTLQRSSCVLFQFR